MGARMRTVSTIEDTPTHQGSSRILSSSAAPLRSHPRGRFRLSTVVAWIYAVDRFTRWPESVSGGGGSAELVFGEPPRHARRLRRLLDRHLRSNTPPRSTPRGGPADETSCDISTWSRTDARARKYSNDVLHLRPPRQATKDLFNAHTSIHTESSNTATRCSSLNSEVVKTQLLSTD